MHDKIDCILPPLPQSIQLGGVPDPDGTRYVLTADGLKALARYIVGLQLWIKAANECLIAVAK